MKLFKTTVLSLFFALYGAALFAQDAPYSETWDINNLTQIGGHAVEVLGNPQIVSTDMGDAVKFDGDADQLLVDFNPLKDAKKFTVELVFKPDACYPNNVEPRFLHIQDPNDSDAKRLLIELRIDQNNKCYMDGFMKTDKSNLTLIDETLTHETEVWQHVAVTYNNGELSTYFNGVKELSGTAEYTAQVVNTLGKTSLGGRMNKRAYYAGIMKTLKVTHEVLDPTDFILIQDDTAAVSVPNIKKDMGITIFSNPANNNIQLSINSLNSPSAVSLTVCNALGKTVANKELNYAPSDIITIDATTFSDGIYFVHVVSNGTSDVSTIAVQH